ncbi:MAG: class I SAM-dependent RNA methyltransferase, partial [Lachnospiraceae bacterium]
MKKGQVLEGVVSRYTFPNKGYVTVTEERKIPGTGVTLEDGTIKQEVEMMEKTISIKGVLPGQKVRFSVKKLRKGGGEGRLLEVLEPSPLENRVPDCPHFGMCGGCAYQTLSYENQLELKKSQVKELLDEVIPYDYDFEGIKKSPVQQGYRNKMEFSFGDSYKDGPLSLGMHKKGSFYDIVTVDGCGIVDGDYTKILRTILDFYTEKEIPYYKKMQHSGSLRHLVIRQTAAGKDILVNLVTTTQTANYPQSNLVVDEATGEKRISSEIYQDVKDYLCLEELQEKLLSLSLNGKIVGMLHTLNDSLSDAVIPEKIVKLYGEDYVYEEILGLKFKISPFSFFQTNSKGAEVLYETARSYVGETKDKVIFDLYSGTGTIAQMLAPVAKKVIGVEIIEEAVEAAKDNAALNGLSNCEFIAGDVLKVIDEIEDKPDIIVLDPPRDGIHPKALDKIIAYGVDEIVYISCKPTSLARDLVIFQEKGYRVVKACAVDQFPGTLHV